MGNDPNGVSVKKVLFFSTWDTNGGASELTYRMAKALIKTGFQVEMLVRYKTTGEKFIHVLPPQKRNKTYYLRIINKLKRLLNIKTQVFETKPEYAFFPDEDESVNHVSVEKILSNVSFTPDYIFSGLTYGFINTNILRGLRIYTGARIYQVMYDISLLTGGCHVIWDCEGFKGNCSNCPAIINKKFKNFSLTNLEIKTKNINMGGIELLVTKGWSLHNAHLSNLYKDREKVIFNIPLDLTLFTDVNRDIAKRIFNIDANFKVIFAGSNYLTDRRKGSEYLLKALEILWTRLDNNIRDNTCVVFAGKLDTEDNLMNSIKFKKFLFEYIKDYRLLSLLYQAGDLFVCPSIEDAGPMMVAESLACGTPVVGFKMGFLFDDSIIIDGYNGYKANIKDSYELSCSIEKILLLNNKESVILNKNARKSAVELFSEFSLIKNLSI